MHAFVPGNTFAAQLPADDVFFLVVFVDFFFFSLKFVKSLHHRVQR